MGAQKLLLPFGSRTVIAHIVDQLLRSSLKAICVVVGHEADRVAGALAGRPVSIATNPDYRTGMLSSVRCGLRALPQDCDAVMVVLGDQPAVTTDLVDELIQSFKATDKGVLVPLHDGKRGHPILFSVRYREEILTQYDDVGLRGLLRAHPADIFEMPVATPTVLSDMDYPEDYRQQVSLFESRMKGETNGNDDRLQR